MLAGNDGYYLVNEMHSNLLSRNSTSTDRQETGLEMDDGRLDDEKYRPRQRRRQPPEAKKVCRVCGDKAFSVNFNVVTCESCKAFFRRNALKTKELRCQTSGNCDISLQTRRSCKKCRLKKCFEVGMIKEWIMSDEARLRKRQLIEKNREKRQRLAALNNKSGDLSDGDMEPMSSESDRPGLDYKPLMCSVPTSVADYSPMSHHWQSPPTSALLQQTSPSSSLMFSQISPPVFQAPPIPNGSHSSGSTSTTTKPLFTMLPTEPAAPTAEPTAQVEETIRVPKTLLAALINQCHSAAITCPHMDASAGHSSSRPSVIVSNKSAPLRCICRCRCGAKAAWAPMGDDSEPEEKCQAVTHQASISKNGSTSSSSDESDSDSELETEDSVSVGSSSALSLISSKKTSREFVVNFNFGVAGTALSHIDDIMNAFDQYKNPIGRWWKDEESSPRMPALRRDEHPGEVAARLDLLCRRMIRFCKKLTTTSCLKKRLMSTLVKASANELVLFHSLAAYIPEEDVWYDKGPHIRPISTRVEMECIKGGVYNEYMKFILSFPRAVKHDVAAILILTAMALFNPNNVSEKDREQVQVMRDFYAGLLRQYLETKFDADKARRIRENMLRHLEVSPQTAMATLPTVVLEMNEQDMEPLLIETLGY